VGVINKYVDITIRDGINGTNESSMVSDYPASDKGKGVLGGRIAQNAEKAMPKLVHSLMGFAGKDETVVLALDETLGEGEINTFVRDLISLFSGLRDNNGYLKRFLKNLVICKGEGKELALKVGSSKIKPENIIVITKAANMDYFDSVKGRATIAGIDDKNFPETAYLPLLEVMLFAVSRHLGWDGSLEEYYGMMYNAVPWKNLPEKERANLLDIGEKTFVIKLIPNARVFGKDIQPILRQIKTILSQA